MNHALIAAEALRFRYGSIQGASKPCASLDVDSAAARAVACADPVIDSAIRRLVTTLVAAGVEPSRLVEPWDAPDVAIHFTSNPELYDLVDVIARQLTLQPAG